MENSGSASGGIRTGLSKRYRMPFASGLSPAPISGIPEFPGLMRGNRSQYSEAENLGQTTSGAFSQNGDSKRNGDSGAKVSTRIFVPQPQEKRRSDTAIPPWFKAFSGSLGGVVEAMCLQPIDVIKTRLQLDHAGRYKGIVHCGSTIIKTEGGRALWKGLTPFATHLTLKYTLRMGSNAMFQTALTDAKTGKLSNSRRMLSGFGAGVLEALVIVTPFEVVKIRLQQQKGLARHQLKYRGPVQCATSIVREEGVLGLWAGAAPTVMRNGTNQAVMFTAKNLCDRVLWGKYEGDGQTLQPWQSMASGFLAGAAGPMATGPFDVVKTRLMAQTRHAVAGEEYTRYTGMVNALHRIYMDEGPRALWKGLLPRLMRIPPGQAIMWAVADQVTGLYEQRFLVSNEPL